MRNRPEHSEALGLEQRCLMPGLWHIEGYWVRKVGQGFAVGRTRGHWVVSRQQVVHRGDPAKTFMTLREARDWIADGGDPDWPIDRPGEITE